MLDNLSSNILFICLIIIAEKGKNKRHQKDKVNYFSQKALPT